MEKTRDVAIRIENLSKCFEIYSHPSDMLYELFTRQTRHKEFWALRDVSFEVRQGEIVGIIGRNGAGKSTLLKILTGTLEKSSGTVTVKGRVSSILELGSGFNPEYSGRQNVLMGGLCLGMSRKEVQDKMEWIIEFSELASVIDQPFRTYSTGMQARLMFSTAVAVDPEILIVDEALSVGDVKFQRKCFNKFEDIREMGCTILFVSHNMDTIDTICDRAIYLQNGAIRSEAKPKIVTGLYLSDSLGGPGQDNHADHSEQSQFRYGNMGAKIIDYAILNNCNERVMELQTGCSYTFFCRVQCCRETVDDLNVGISVRTVKGVNLFGVNPVVQKQRTPKLNRGDVLEVKVDVTMWLAPGDYFMTFGAWGYCETGHYDRLVDVLHFKVRGEPGLTDSIVNLVPQYHMSVTSGLPSP
jgi:lipopolysaccharide transport system ATP-binding protein